MKIPLHTLPASSRYPKMVRCIIASNLAAGQNHGKGNRAKRRAGLAVVDPFTLRPFGCVALDRAGIARMMRTPATA